MSDRKGRGPAKRLFYHPDDDLPARLLIDDIIDRLSELQCSEFREKYQFDLITMQPCTSDSNLHRTSTDVPALRQSWSWEAVDARLVPRFYRRRDFKHTTGSTSTYSASPSSSVENEAADTPPPPTPVKKLHELRKARPSTRDATPPVKSFFPTVRRSTSVEMLKRKELRGPECSPSRSQSSARAHTKTPNAVLLGSPRTTSHTRQRRVQDIEKCVL
ncbi:unnamed protein product [Mesocestoides corti]|uniref:Cyclin-dependent kinase inhibitor domain-containing protein n=1 Tax=Mesocestoides corti TaxID=53468 RepID=A0A0R3UBJ9_MESCO|nr:unnamed protein product [Mesocestoides corti]